MALSDPMPRTFLATLAALLALAVPASAAPSKTFTIRGAGFGHGVGMSQYGAMGYASHGWNAAQILSHYYNGTALGTTDPAAKVRIRLIEETSSARISGARQAGSRSVGASVSWPPEAGCAGLTGRPEPGGGVRLRVSESC